MSSLYCRSHCCGFNAIYGMSQFNSVLKIWPIQFSGSLLLYGKYRVIFVDFFTIFAYEIVNIDVESTKIVTKMQTMNRITKKSWRWKFLKILVKIDRISTKNAIFLQICDLFKITFCVITRARMKLVSWNLVTVCRKKLQKLVRSRIFNF